MILAFLHTALAASVVVIDFDAVEVTADRLSPSVHLVQEFNRPVPRSSFTYQELVGVLNDRALRSNGTSDSVVRWASELDIIPIASAEEAVGIELAVYDAETSHVMPVGAYEYYMYSSASGITLSGYAVVGSEGGINVLRDWPEDGWCVKSASMKEVGFFYGENEHNCEPDSASPHGIYASRFAWEQRETGRYIPAESFLYNQARRLRDTASPKTTGWCPEGSKEWGELEDNCRFRIPAVQMYEVSDVSLVDPDERVFMLGSPASSNPSTHGGLVGFFRYIPDVADEREKRIHAYFDSYTQAPFSASTWRSEHGTFEVLSISDVRAVYGASSVLLSYTSESAVYYEEQRAKCTVEVGSAQKKACRNMWDPKKVTPVRQWTKEYSYNEYFGDVTGTWNTRALPPTNVEVLDIRTAIP
jgi:hypothetical protein